MTCLLTKVIGGKGKGKNAEGKGGGERRASDMLTNLATPHAEGGSPIRNGKEVAKT